MKDSSDAVLRSISVNIHCIKSRSFKTFKTEVRREGAGDFEVQEDPLNKVECMRGLSQPGLMLCTVQQAGQEGGEGQRLITNGDK